MTTHVTELYDEKGNGSHYKEGSLEVIEMIERIWGIEATIQYCEINAFKYRMRMGKKDAPELEMKKVGGYGSKAKELKEKRKPQEFPDKPFGDCVVYTRDYGKPPPKTETLTCTGNDYQMPVNHYLKIGQTYSARVDKDDYTRVWIQVSPNRWRSYPRKHFKL